MHVELQVWVRERKPATAVEAVQLADDYVQVRRTAVDPSKEARRNPNERSRSTTNKGCFTCGQEGHIAQGCRRGAKSPRITSTAATSTRAAPKTGREGINCYNCGQRGHIATSPLRWFVDA